MGFSAFGILGSPIGAAICGVVVLGFVLLVTLGFGRVGWVDDYRKVVHHDPKGMSAREKYF